MKAILVWVILIAVGFALWRKAVQRPRTSLDDELQIQEDKRRAAGFWTTKGMLAKPAVSTVGAQPYTGISGSRINSFDQQPGSTQFRPTVAGTAAGVASRMVTAFGRLFPPLDPDPDKTVDSAPKTLLRQTS